MEPRRVVRLAEMMSGRLLVASNLPHSTRGGLVGRAEAGELIRLARSVEVNRRVRPLSVESAVLWKAHSWLEEAIVDAPALVAVLVPPEMRTSLMTKGAPPSRHSIGRVQPAVPDACAGRKTLPSQLIRRGEHKTPANSPLSGRFDDPEAMLKGSSQPNDLQAHLLKP